jgi:hypothetical protein
MRGLDDDVAATDGPGSSAYPIGRLVEVKNSNAKEVDSYDTRGRIAAAGGPTSSQKLKLILALTLGAPCSTCAAGERGVLELAL